MRHVGSGENIAVRFLFSFTGGSGHFLPTAPYARVLARRGHEILYTCQERTLGMVAAQGWQVEPSGGASLLDLEARRPLVPVDRKTEERAVRTFFAGRAAEERAGRLVSLIERWQPDLVVRDEMDFGAAVAAEAVEVPHAAVVVMAAGGFTKPDVVQEPLAALRAQHRLDPGGAMEMLHRFLTLVPVPPSYRNPQDPLPATARWVQPAIFEHFPLEWRATSEADGHVPRVYFTLGTIFPQESGDLFRRVLSGLRRLPVDVTVTTGEAIAAEELGRQPATVRIERFLPLEEALAASDIVVSHGGSGTVISALALGLPQLLLPVGADQPNNADRCQDLGVGLALDSVKASPAEIADAVTAMLQTTGYRRKAVSLAKDSRTLIDAEQAESLLETVAWTGSPITTMDRGQAGWERYDITT